MYTGIEFNGKHSLRDFGLTVSNREIGYPSKIKRQERVPFSNTVYDFSSLYGGQEYEERSITYTLNLINKSSSGYRENFQNNQLLETKVVNWLMGANQKAILKDDTIDGYYFMAELVDGPNSEFRFVGSELTIEFIAYPFKISELPEGHDIWDEFNFELDAAQPITFHPMRSTFRPLGIGDTITIGVWSGQFDGLDKIEHGLLGRSYKVGSVRSTTQGDSARAYYISELGQWLIEQDAVEAQEGAVEVNLINAGISSVAPTIETDIDLTIVREDGDVFNLKKGTIKSDLFRLYPGENKMIISGWTKTRYEPGNVKLTWHKELI